MGRWTRFGLLGAMLLSACADSSAPLRIDVPVDPADRSLLTILWANDQSPRLFAYPLENGVPTENLQLPISHKDEFELSALVYRRDLASLGLQPGEVTLAEAEAPSSPLEQPDALYHSQVRSFAHLGWQNYSKLTERQRSIRLPKQLSCGNYSAIVHEIDTSRTIPENHRGAISPAVAVPVFEEGTIFDDAVVVGYRHHGFYLVETATVSHLGADEIVSIKLRSATRMSGYKYWLAREGDGSIWEATLDRRTLNLAVGQIGFLNAHYEFKWLDSARPQNDYVFALGHEWTRQIGIQTGYLEIYPPPSASAASGQLYYFQQDTSSDAEFNRGAVAHVSRDEAWAMWPYWKEGVLHYYQSQADKLEVDTPTALAYLPGYGALVGNAAGELLRSQNGEAFAKVDSLASGLSYLSLHDYSFIAATQDGLVRRYLPEQEACEPLPVPEMEVYRSVSVEDSIVLVGKRRGTERNIVVWLSPTKS